MSGSVLVLLLVCFAGCTCTAAANADVPQRAAPEPLAGKALRFLQDNAQGADRSWSLDRLQVTIEYALKPLDLYSWAAAVPESIWLNNVLPYAVVNEPRTQWRPLFFNLLADSVRNCTSIPEAAQLINQQLWGIFHVHYVPDCTPLFMSPAQVWNNGTWSFTGAAEWSPQGLNHTWFYPDFTKGQVPGSHRHGIWATSWEPTGQGHFPMDWAREDTSVPGVDVTEHYLGKAAMQAAADTQR